MATTTAPSKTAGTPSFKLPKVFMPEERTLNSPGQLVSALAHEVRNPLSNINMAVELLKESAMDEEQKLYLDIVIRASARINDLVTDLLTSPLADELLLDKHSMHTLLDEVIDMAGDRIMLRHVNVLKQYCDEDCRVFLNRAKVKMALTNIVINAIEAMNPFSGELKVITRSIGGSFLIQIEDNGCGISPENLKYLFKPYFSMRPGGMGLGLVTTYNILRSNKVLVNVESKEGEWTRFILLFEKK
ncbi:MAG: HAMP domain-containing histidine kinase [Chitinophagaceae bacterium]|nr:HAMP domain-containing histidine kinase [Chitinophagaceae bacterium]